MTPPTHPRTWRLGRIALATATLALSGGCVDYLTGSINNVNDFSGDPFPIDVDTTTGAIVVGAQLPGEDPRTAVLDVLSPVTLVDRGPNAEPSIAYPDITLLGERTPNGPLDLPRARFKEPRVLTLHPCTTGTCVVGSPLAPRPFNALIGLDVFASDALRLHLASDEIYVLPDIAGDETHRTRSCDAVLPSPFRGGGTLLVGGTETSFTNWRLAVDACLAPNPDPAALQSARGVDALLVLTTAIGPSLLDETAYARYRTIDASAPALDALPVTTVDMPSGPITGRRTTISSVALVGNSGSNPRAPCRQVYAHHLLAQRDCAADEADCPCPAGVLYCTVPAIVELAPANRLEVLIVADSDPTLQALRTELRPDQPEVDGLLGTSALRSVELDIDYAHDRMLGRCTDPAACTARPELTDAASRHLVQGCLGI